MSKIHSYVLALIASVMSFFAPMVHAAADITAITAAQTDLLAYAAAMLALGVAVWGALKAVRFFGGR